MHHGKCYRLEPVVSLEDGRVVGYDIHAIHECSGPRALSASFFTPPSCDDYSSLLCFPFHGLSSKGMRLHIRLSVWTLATDIHHIKANDSAIRVVELLHAGLITNLTINQRRVFDTNLKELLRSGCELWVTGILPETIDVCGKLALPLHGIKFHRDILSHGTWYLRELQYHSKAYAPAILIDGIDSEDRLLRSRMCGAHFGQGRLWEELTLVYRDGHCIPETLAMVQ